MRGPAIASLLAVALMGGAVFYAYREDAKALAGCSARAKDALLAYLKGLAPDDLCAFLPKLVEAGIAAPVETDVVTADKSIDCHDVAAVSAYVAENWDLTDDEASAIAKHFGLVC